MFLANTYQQDLVEHSFAVGVLALEIFKKFYNEDKYNILLKELDIHIEDEVFKIKNIEDLLLNVGFFHDIGKIESKFQKYIRSKLKNGNNYSEEEQCDVQVEEEIECKTDKTFSLNNCPLHQEISWAIASTFFSNPLKHFVKNTFLYGIYWHHAKLQRTNKNKTLTPPFSKATEILNTIDTSDIIENFEIYMEKLDTIQSNYFSASHKLYIPNNKNNLEDIMEEAKTKTTPQFQPSDFLSKTSTNYIEKNEFMKNAIMHLVRSIVVSADRIVSSLSKDELSEHVREKTIECLICLIEKEKSDTLSFGIEKMLEDFNIKYGKSSRSIKQETVAQELSDVDDIAVLYGPAGVGKTKIMLDWVGRINNGKKVFIIVPKTSIAFSLYQEIRTEYLPSNSVEIVTGDVKKISNNHKEIENQDGLLYQSEINITTIDQIMGMMLSHNKIDIFLEVLDSNLIFDEYHEFMDTPGIIMLFIQLIYLKRFSSNSRTLLVSATPNYFLLKEKLKINISKSLKQIESFNNTLYTVNLESFPDANYIEEVQNKMFNSVKNSEIVLFNSATKAQVSAIRAIKEGEKNTLVYHSKFTVLDRQKIFNTIIREFGKKNPTKNNTLRVGPVLQASIDISTSHMYTEISTIDNIFQRLGRVVRWSEYPTGEYTIFIPENIEKGTIKKSLEYMNNYNSTSEFVKFINIEIKNGSQWKLNDLYPLYSKFFNSRTTIKAYEEDWIRIKEESKKIFDQGFEPVKILFKSSATSKTMSKKSLRGKSIFGLACVLTYMDKKENIAEIKTEDFSQQLFSVDKNLFHAESLRNNMLEENREQISTYFNSSPVMKIIEKELKTKKIFKNKKSNISQIPAPWFLDFARNEKTPLMFSFSRTLIKKNMNYDEQYFNVIYHNVFIGIISYKLFNKIK